MPRINVERGVFLLPDEVSFEQGAFIEPLACVVRGQRLAQLKSGQSVLILGSGISGLLHLMLARVQGAGRLIITDINEDRLRTAERFGADAALNAKDDIPARLKQVNHGRLADLVIVCTSALAAFKQALESVDRGGTVLFFASTDPGIQISLPVDKFWRNSVTLLTSYANSPQDAQEAIALIRSGRVCVDKMITHRLSLTEAPLGFKLVSGGKNSIKVIINPHKPE